MSEVLGLFCIEAVTEQCICPRRPCGGIKTMLSRCPEHYNPISPEGKCHSHPVQVERKPVYRAIAV